MKDRRVIVIGALAVAALLSLLLWWGETPAGQPPGEEQQVHAAPRVPPSPPERLEVEREALPVQRVEPEPEPSVELPLPDLAHEFEFSLTLNLRGRFGVPVAGASVFVAPPHCGFTRWPQESSGRGQVAMRWRGKQRSMTVTVAVLAHGVLQPMRQVTLQHKEPRELAMGVRSQQQSVVARYQVAERRPEQFARDARRVRRERERGQKLGRMQRLDELDVLCGRTMLLFQQFDCTECHEPGRVSGYHGLASAGAMVPTLHKHAVFQDLGAYQADARALERDRRRRAGKLRQQWREASRERRAPRGGYVVGVVRDLDGEPLGGVPVCQINEDGELARTTISGKDGTFRLGPFETGAVNVIAAGGRAGFAIQRLNVVAGQRTDWSPELRRFRTVAGKVLDDQGRPLQGWFVELARDEGEWAAVVETDPDGAFAVHGVPGTVVTSVWPRDAARGMPVLYGTAAMVDASEIQLALHRDVPTRARLRVHVGVPASLRGARIDARVVQVDTGVVGRLASVGHEDAFELQPLPPGAYRLQLGATGAGWVETGDVVVDGRGLWDVGRLELPGPGRVRIRYVGDREPLAHGRFAFYRRTPDCDVLSRHRDLGDAFELPPGEHVLIWSDEGGRRAVGFEVVSGNDTELVIGPSR